MSARNLATPIAAALLSVLPAQAPAPHLETIAAMVSTARTSAFAIQDIDGDGRAEIVLIEHDGAVRIHQLDAGGALVPRPGEALQLARPAHSLLALADIVGDRKTELVVLSTDGAFAHTLDDAGRFATEPITLTTAGRLGFRVGAPRFVDFVQDVNADGAPDLVVPRGGECELWLRVPGGDTPRFELSQTLPIEFDHGIRAEAAALSDDLRNRIRIPRLDIEDLNGDGRPDLKVREGDRRSFFLQDEAGRFAEQPIVLDLSIFQDTTPKASVRMGETLVLSDSQQYQSGDLNGDGIPDHVIAHRRKVWSFLASRDGPQFTKSRTRMVAEDISGMLLLHLDDDDREDLLVFKVDVPTAGQLVLGLVSSIDVGVTVLGYATDENGDFEPRARWRRELTLRAPSLLRLLGEATDLVQRFTEVLSKFRWSTIGDFDGDGAPDLTLLGEEGKSAELWLRPSGGERLDRSTERWLRGLLFENPDTVFDLERLLKLAAQIFDTRTSSLTGERAADARGALPERQGRYVLALRSADLDGDGRAEVIVVDDDESAPDHIGIVVLRWTGTE